MTVTHSDAARAVVAEQVPNLVDAGSANATGKIVFLTAADAVISNHNFTNPAFDGQASGSNNATHPDAVSTPGGTIAKFELRDRDDAKVSGGTVSLTGGGGDIERDLLVIPVGATVKGGVITYNAAP